MTLAIAILAIGYVVWPLFRVTNVFLPLNDDRLSGLMLRKETVLNSIKELEFDYQTGKLNEDDYDRLNQSLRRQAIGLLQRIEKIAPMVGGLDDELEQAISARRQEVATLAASESTPHANNGTASVVCPQCDHPMTATAKFCAQCGTPLR